MIWASTGATRSDGECGVSLESLEAVARDVSAALRHEERRCGYVSRECGRLLSAGADLEETGGLKVAAQLEASSLGRELVEALRGACEGCVRVRFNRWIAVCGRLALAPSDGRRRSKHKWDDEDLFWDAERSDDDLDGGDKRDDSSEDLTEAGTVVDSLDASRRSLASLAFESPTWARLRRFDSNRDARLSLSLVSSPSSQ